VGRVVRLVDQGDGAQQVSLELVEIEETEQDKIMGIWNLLLKASSFRVSPGIPPC
jgi:hypothetical protein